ncbi:MAG: DUF3368 domain-containing protein [bacterium]|nr:DUF3368 domain-containing protein [bacterium]
MIIIDNTVLSNFALISSIRLVQKACQPDKVGITQYVIDEFNQGVKTGKLPQSDISWMLPCHFETREEEKLFRQISLYLGKGESSCLSIAINRDYKLLTDDWDAREWGLREGVSISGSVGVLVDLVCDSSITLKEGNELLSELIKKGYYSPVPRLNELVKQED